MTDAERRPCTALRAHWLAGFSFRRQTPIGPFIVDFVCQQLRLIIEVERGQHAESIRDIERDAWLASTGYQVLRFWNSDIFKKTAGVLEAIIDAARRATPLPSSPSQGGGEQAEASG